MVQDLVQCARRVTPFTTNDEKRRIRPSFDLLGSKEVWLQVFQESGSDPEKGENQENRDVRAHFFRSVGRRKPRMIFAFRPLSL